MPFRLVLLRCLPAFQFGLFCLDPFHLALFALALFCLSVFSHAIAHAIVCAIAGYMIRCLSAASEWRIPSAVDDAALCKKMTASPGGQTCAMHQPMSALHPIATAKADTPQMVMSALHPKADMWLKSNDHSL
jgi:hypothetical protein